MSTTNFRSGKTGRLTIGAANIPIKSWRVTEKSELLDVTHTESSGHGEYIAGIQDHDVNIAFEVSVSVFPFGTTPLAAGTAVTMNLIESTADSNTTWIVSVIPETLETGIDVRGTISGTCQGKVTGAASTRPTS